MSKNGESPISAYAVVSHISFVVLTPLLLFIAGGAWLCEKFGLPDWLLAVFVFVGIFTMIVSLVTYLVKIIDRYGGKKEKDKYSALKTDRKDNDYYYENKVKTKR